MHFPMPRLGRTLWSLLGLVWVLGACRSVPPGLVELDKIEFEGNKALDDDEIRKELLLKPSSPIPFWGQQRYFDDTILADDLERITRLYEAHGIFGTVARVREVRIDQQVARVVVRIDEGAAVRVEELSIDGFPGTPPHLKSAKGKTFSEKDYEDDKGEMVKALTEEGYLFAAVKGEVRVDRDRNLARIAFQVTPGRRWRLGKMEVKGAGRVNAERIRHVTELREGEWLRASQLEFARRALLQLGVFSVVKVEAGPEPASGDELPLVIEVTDGPAQTLGLGAGFSVDNSQQQINGVLNYRHNDFLGGLRRLTVEARPSYIFAPTYTTREAEGWGGQASVSFLQPDFLLQKGVEHVGFFTSARYRRDFRLTYATQSGVMRAGFVWPQYGRSTLELGIDGEIFTVERLPRVVQPRGCLTLCLLGYLDQKAVWDERDAQLLPRRGWYASLALTEAGLFGDFSYLQVEPELRGYYSPWERTTVAARLEGGILNPLEGSETPLVKRFFGGGPNGHRGFPQGELSPAARNSRTGDWVKVGGNTSFLASLEGRQRLAESLYGALFLDSGDVQREPLRFDFSKLNEALGVGILYNSPLAPIRLDVAYRLQSRPQFRERGLGRWAFQLNFGDGF